MPLVSRSLALSAILALLFPACSKNAEPSAPASATTVPAPPEAAEPPEAPVPPPSVETPEPPSAVEATPSTSPAAEAEPKGEEPPPSDSEPTSKAPSKKPAAKVDEGPAKITLNVNGEKKGVVEFAHREHQKRVECVKCHHETDADAKSRACRACHGKQAEAAPMKKVAHDHCKGCHKTEGKGPTKCKDCHAEKQ